VTGSRLVEGTQPIELLLPAGGRKWINANQRMFFMERSRRTKEWRQLAMVRALAEHLPYVGYAHIICELLFADTRRRDPANWAPTAKACVDGLVDARVFTDDDHKHVTGPDMRIGKKVTAANVGVRLLIYPIGRS
jgi:hypothetical protein